MTKTRNKILFLLFFVIIFLIYIIFSFRGQYLELLSIDSKYTQIFNQNFKYKLIIFASTFVLIYISLYITTRFIKSGLRKFFKEEKKEETKLPNKSISFVFSLIGAFISTKFLFDKLIIFLNSTWFR